MALGGLHDMLNGDSCTPLKPGLKIGLYADFRLSCPYPHCRSDGDISTTVQAIFAADMAEG